MIYPHVVVASRLQWLGGDGMKAIEDTFHLSLSSAQRVVNRFLQAVRECDHPDCVIELPKDDELEAIAEGWKNCQLPEAPWMGVFLQLMGSFLPGSNWM
jgi:hypothetical protein